VEQFRLSLEQQAYTVSSITEEIRRTLDRGLGSFRVEGELSGVKFAPSGHVYFDLKDSGAKLPCVSYRSSAVRLKVKPADGLQVIAHGRLDVYPPKGAYQMVVEALEPLGLGARLLALEQLKKRLQAEGLLDPARKRPMPKHPRRIGLVTSPSGAVIQDMIQVFGRRHPGLHLRLFPVQVQGESAAGDVVRALRYFSESGWPEVVIVARGGGSIEDLWTFNEEAVARAIAGCAVPVISAIGHETDFTLADLVADVRAATPSVAAETAVPKRDDLLAGIEGLRRSAQRVMEYRLSKWRQRVLDQGAERPAYALQRRIRQGQQRVDEAAGSLAASSARRFREWKLRLAELRERLERTDVRLRLAAGRRRLASLDLGLAGWGKVLANQARRRLERVEPRLGLAMAARLARIRRRYDRLAPVLAKLDPKDVLKRGYAIVLDPGGTAVRKAPKAGTRLRVLVEEGEFPAESQ
jgi:exodeoxyribonuclease VII large subunit